MKVEASRPSYIEHKIVDVISVSKIVTMHYFEFDKNYYFAGEQHNFWEMVYVDSGKIHITADTNSYVLEQGDIIFHKPNEFHQIYADKKTPSNVFIISFVARSKSMMWFKDKKTNLPKHLKHYIKTLMEEGEKTFDLPFNKPELRELTLSKTSPFGGEQIIRNTLEQLLIMLLRGEEQNEKSMHIFPDKESMDNHLVNSIMRMLSEHIYGKITVEEICQNLNYSRTYLSKIFSKNCGYTIIEYYTKLKIKEAKKLIRENAYSFAEISNMLCFNNPHYFSRVFKKSTNMTPRDYLHSVVK